MTKAHHERAIELGLYATNMPTSVGGRGCTALQQVLVQEQAGRVTNGIAWCCATPPSWWPEVANDHQRETWLLPTVRGEMEECYAITEEDAGSDVSDLTATARRDGDDYVLDGVKWHVTSFNEADYVFFQAVLTDRSARRRPGAVRRRQGHARGARRPHADVHAHPRPRAPDRRVRGRAGAGQRTWSAARRTA